MRKGSKGREVSADELRDWLRHVGDRPQAPRKRPKGAQAVAAAGKPGRRRLADREVSDWNVWLSTGSLPDHEGAATLEKDAPEQQTAKSARLNGHKAPPPGDTWAIDRKLQRRLRSGQIEPERKIDLHGMTRAEAEGALGRFFAAALGANCRLTLVVTGKGLRSSSEGRWSSGGVLKALLPIWLKSGPVSRSVQFFCEAHASHGGSGAYYVLLRRRKIAAPVTRP